MEIETNFENRVFEEYKKFCAIQLDTRINHLISNLNRMISEIPQRNLTSQPNNDLIQKAKSRISNEIKELKSSFIVYVALLKEDEMKSQIISSISSSNSSISSLLKVSSFL